MNQGILGNARATGGSPSRPFATPAQARDGTDASLVISPAALASTRRGTGREWFWEAFNDFVFAASGLPISTDGFTFSSQVSGAGADGTLAGPLNNQFSGRPVAGLLTLSTGTTSTGRAGYDSNNTTTTHRFDTGRSTFEGLIYLPDLSSATEEYIFRIGWCQGNSLSGSMLFFEYDRSVSTNWRGGARYYGSGSYVDLGVPVTQAQWIMLRIEVDGSRNQGDFAVASFFVNNTLCAVHTSNVPGDGSSRMGCHLLKTAGTTSRSAVIDYVYYRHDFGTRRTFS